MFKLKSISLLTVFIVTGCTSLAPNYQQPNLPVPAGFNQEQLAQTQGNNVAVGWQTFFTDQSLKNMVSVALKQNRDLRLASLKVLEARQQYLGTRSDQFPNLNLSSEASFSGGVKYDTNSKRGHDLGLMSSFELNLFGRLRNMSAADLERYFASEQAQRSAHILLVSSVAQGYLNERLATQQLLLAEQTLKSSQYSFDVIEQQLSFGKSNLLALEQSKTMLEAARAEVAKRKNEQAQAQHQLRFLTGSYDLSFASTAEGSLVKFITLPKGLSSNVLLQRPDIVEAEHKLLATNADIGVARAAFFPTISLTGGITNSSTNLVDLFDLSTGVWKFLPKIELPIFNAGKNKANLSLAELRKEQAIVEYEQKIQTAFKEVSQGLSIKETIAEQITAQRQYLDAQQRTLTRASFLYQNGSGNYLEVLDAQRGVFAAQQSLLDLSFTQKINEVSLFVALGGGWKRITLSYLLLNWSLNMKKLLVTSLVSFVVGTAVLSTSVFADNKHAGMHNAETKNARMERATQTKGVIKGIDTENKKLTIEHERIPSLSWPAMTMRFTYEDPALIEGIKVDDKVELSFVQIGAITLLQTISVAN